jgi:hypothetical protein
MVDLQAEQSTLLLRTLGRTGCLLGCSHGSTCKTLVARTLQRKWCNGGARLSIQDKPEGLFRGVPG